MLKPAPEPAPKPAPVTAPKPEPVVEDVVKEAFEDLQGELDTKQSEDALAEDEEQLSDELSQQKEFLA